MAQSSPEGIHLGKGCKLVSFNLKVSEAPEMEGKLGNPEDVEILANIEISGTPQDYTELRDEVTLKKIAEKRHRELVTAPVGIIPNFVDGFLEGYEEAKNDLHNEEEVLDLLWKLYSSPNREVDFTTKGEVKEWFNRIRKK